MARPRPSDVQPVPLPLAGESEPVRSACVAFQQASRRRVPVLIDAEQGLRAADVALALHTRSGSTGPFTAFDCSTEDPSALERRLFGGGARRTGDDLEAAGADSVLAEAGAGTIFFDRIDELPVSIQRRLARLLRDGEMRIHPSGKAVRAEFRVVAATSRDLEGEAREGRFREDLLRRLAIRIPVPPLRRRSEDIPAVLERLAGETGCPFDFTGQAITVIKSLPWPGNIDELAGMLARLAGTAETIKAETVLASLPTMGHAGRMDLTASLREARRQFERDYIAAVLERHRWSMSDAARTLGIERANLYRKTRQLGITRASREFTTVQR